MTDNNKSFQIKKTFGVGVLMKLTKKTVPGIKIDTVGDNFVSNVSPDQLKELHIRSTWTPTDKKANDEV